MIWLLAVACLAGTVLAGVRWLRVAQREHYLAPEVTRFQWRWWTSSIENITLAVIALGGAALSVVDIRWAFLVPLTQIGPIGLSVRGVTSPLAWTDRLRRVASLAGALVLFLLVFGGITSQPLILVLPVLILPTLIDLSLTMLAPVERRQGDKWVGRAAYRLRSVGPDVVAITGSYGKTTTKNYLAHLLSGTKRVVASPASFNNRMGLARAINENLTPGTEVFIAEMGTYGVGEIAELCEWIKPKVSAIVAIGPVHLERFRSIETIVTAKAEILDGAETGVICVDHPLLADLAARRSETMEIFEVSTGEAGRVVVGDDGIEVDGVTVADTPATALRANLAVALGIGLALGVEAEDLTDRIEGLPATDHRQKTTRAESGFLIIDDTFNSNPVGARSALATLTSAGRGGATAVITPGMVELGAIQADENRAFAHDAAGVVDHFVIVGKTNRRALLAGSADRRAAVTVVDSREEAVAWARENLGPGDAALYENDLPDHYP